jgi:hypothetical protein
MRENCPHARAPRLDGVGNVADERVTSINCVVVEQLLRVRV